MDIAGVVHTTVMTATALLLLAALWHDQRRGILLSCLGAACVAPVLAVLFAGDTEAVLGSEGMVEAITEGILLAILIRAIPLRSPWMVAAAALLLLEELDYGQVVFGFETPAFLIPPDSRSEKLNFHNAWFAGLWRAVPIGGMLLLALPRERLPSWVDHLRLPRFHRAAWLGVALAIPLALGVNTWLGHRAADESFELAMVCLVCASWIIPSRRSHDPRP